MNNNILTLINSSNGCYGDTLRSLSNNELDTLCDEIRDVLINIVAKNGGHLSSNLGVVEITVALHKAFNLPNDQIVWDVGHQAYVHKLLTGRFADFDTLRQEGGISGFPHPNESIFDVAVAGHSSTSISIANGLAKAKALSGKEDYAVAVIGDGALTSGLAYEGLSNAGRSKDKLIVVLNDNGMSISENVGYVARHLTTLKSTSSYVKFKNRVKKILSAIPLIGKFLNNGIMNIKTDFKKKVYKKSSFFEEMGFYYIGPLDGHDLNELSKGLEAAKNINRPVLIHIATEKGKGYKYSEKNPDIYHSVPAFNVETGVVPTATTNFSSVFGDQLVRLADADDKICAISAAMTVGTGLAEFESKFKKRYFDVGIAEEHAVAFAAGLAAGGIVPVFAVYSTFLQRSYDQIINDASIQNEHVVLAIDRVGIVGEDGVTHQGIFDVPFLNTVPNVTIFSPSCYAELRAMMSAAIYDTKGLVAIRYPRGGELGDFRDHVVDCRPYTLFKANCFEDNKIKPLIRKKVLLITYGRVFSNARDAAKKLNFLGYDASLLKLNIIKPLEDEYVKICSHYDFVIFFEESSINGGVAERLGVLLLAGQRCKFNGVYEIVGIDGFVAVCKPLEGLKKFNLDVDGMVLRTVRLIESNSSSTMISTVNDVREQKT